MNLATIARWIPGSRGGSDDHALYLAKRFEVHVGLSDNAAYDRIDVQGPGGVRETFPGGKANQIVKLTQGKGTPAAQSRPRVRPR